jgi:hypothetical protein
MEPAVRRLRSMPNFMAAGGLVRSKPTFMAAGGLEGAATKGAVSGAGTKRKATDPPARAVMGTAADGCAGPCRSASAPAAPAMAPAASVAAAAAVASAALAPAALAFGGATATSGPTPSFSSAREMEMEVPRPLHPTEVPRPLHPTEVPRPLHPTEVPRPLHPTEVPRPLHPSDLARLARRTLVRMGRGSFISSATNGVVGAAAGAVYGCAPADGVLGAVLGIKRLDDDSSDEEAVVGAVSGAGSVGARGDPPSALPLHAVGGGGARAEPVLRPRGRAPNGSNGRPMLWCSSACSWLEDTVSRTPRPLAHAMSLASHPRDAVHAPCPPPAAPIALQHRHASAHHDARPACPPPAAPATINLTMRDAAASADRPPAPLAGNGAPPAVGVAASSADRPMERESKLVALYAAIFDDD